MTIEDERAVAYTATDLRIVDNTAEAELAHYDDFVDEITDEIADLAYQLGSAGRRLKIWCVEKLTDYAIVCELARGVAISAERVAAELRQQTD